MSALEFPDGEFHAKLFVRELRESDPKLFGPDLCIQTNRDFTNLYATNEVYTSKSLRFAEAYTHPCATRTDIFNCEGNVMSRSSKIHVVPMGSDHWRYSIGHRIGSRRVVVPHSQGARVDRQGHHRPRGLHEHDRRCSV